MLLIFVFVCFFVLLQIFRKYKTAQLPCLIFSFLKRFNLNLFILDKLSHLGNYTINKDILILILTDKRQSNSLCNLVCSCICIDVQIQYNIYIFFFYCCQLNCDFWLLTVYREVIYRPTYSVKKTVLKSRTSPLDDKAPGRAGGQSSALNPVNQAV